MAKKSRKDEKECATTGHTAENANLKNCKDKNLINNVLGYDNGSLDALQGHCNGEEAGKQEGIDFDGAEMLDEEYSEMTGSTASLEDELFASSSMTSSSVEEQLPALWADSESMEEHDLCYLKDKQPDDLNVSCVEKKEVQIMNKLFRCNTRVIRMMANEKYLVVLDARGYLYKFEKDGQDLFKLTRSFKMDKYFVVDMLVTGDKLVLVSNKTGILKEIDLCTFDIVDIRTNIRYFDRVFELQDHIFLVNRDIVLVLDGKYQKKKIYHFDAVLDIKFADGRFYFLNSSGFFVVQGDNIAKVVRKEYFNLTCILIHDDHLYLGTEYGLKIDERMKKYGPIKMVDVFNDHVIVVSEDALRLLSDDCTRTWKMNVGCAVFFHNSVVFSDGKFLGVLRF